MTDTGSTPRLAVLIDADNTSHRHAADLLEEVARYGIPTVRRAYGDWTTPRLGGWKDELNRHAITPVQQFAYTTGKNSTDSALIIDAMDLLYTGNLDAFAIVSSDSDFTRLVTRLRESGRTVYGLGRRRTPQSLVAACDKFIYLEVLGTAADKDDASSRPTRSRGDDAPDEGDESDEEVPELPELRPLVTSAIDATSNDDGWSHLGAVGSYLTTRHASFDPRNYGFSKLISLARAQDYLEVEQDTGNAPKVRVKPAPTKKRAPRKTAAKKKAAASAAGEKPADEPAADKPADRPADKSGGKPADKPADKSGGQSGEKPADKPAGKPARKAAEKAAEKPAEKPAETSASTAPKVTTRTRSSRTRSASATPAQTDSA